MTARQRGAPIRHSSKPSREHTDGSTGFRRVERDRSQSSRWREGITARYVRRLLGLAFLAPVMVEAIAGGHQPPDLTAEALSQRINLPPDWSAQKEALDLR